MTATDSGLSLPPSRPPTARSPQESRWSRCETRCGDVAAISLPFTDHCPVLSDSDSARDALLGLLRERAAAERVASVELRTAVGPSTVPESVVGVLHELALGPDCDEVYGRFDKSRVRGSIKRAQRDGVTVRAAESEDDVAHTYYDLHVRTRRRLGVRRSRSGSSGCFGSASSRPGSGSFSSRTSALRSSPGRSFFQGNGHLIYKFAASDEAHRKSQPNHAILWEAIRRGCERGCRAMDFGRSGPTDHGLRAFKSGWGAVSGRSYTRESSDHHRASPRAARRKTLCAACCDGRRSGCVAASDSLYRYAA